MIIKVSVKTVRKEESLVIIDSQTGDFRGKIGSRVPINYNYVNRETGNVEEGSLVIGDVVTLTKRGRSIFTGTVTYREETGEIELYGYGFLYDGVRLNLTQSDGIFIERVYQASLISEGNNIGGRLFALSEECYKKNFEG